MQDQTIASQLAEDTSAFNQKAAALGFGDLSSYYWYHTIDLPNGLVTPGVHDYRRTIAEFQFPGTMRGMRVLDVGSATGFFAFEFAKRGAEVTSLEIPSLRALDRFPGQSVEEQIAKIETMLGSSRRYTAEEMSFFLLEGPFEFCRRQLDISLQRCAATIYEIPAALERSPAFDLVFLGDILIHTLNPLEALAAAASVCRGTLVLAQEMPESADGQPLMMYRGGETIAEDEILWWQPNEPCFVQLLKKLGFGEVFRAGIHAGIVRPSGYRYKRTILHATRRGTVVPPALKAGL